MASRPYNHATLALTPGTRLGVYEVLAQIGEGGMGQVFRARDTKLDRDVAIKVLPEAFAQDADRLARFTREAKTLASLNHPNIAAIYGLEESSGITALVMELVEGEDLSQRIARLRAPGASARQAGMPLDEALPVAKQIAEALEAAHEQGIVHRDLKPANIKVRADGTVKVLDFGLAKALDPTAASSAATTNSPTIATPAHLRHGHGAAGTEAGMILGTAAYMAPEQARGAIVDKRADVWAFGVVLWEMLTGQRLFAGATVSDTLAAVLTREPDWTTVPADTPAPIRTLLRRCLEKDRKRRLDSAAAARLEIDDAMTPPTAAEATSASGASPGPTAAGGRRGAVAALALAALSLVALAVPAVRHLRETPPPLPAETRLEISTPAATDPFSFAISPDGRQLVFAAAADGAASQLWLRPLDAVSAEPIAGTEDATYPFWSPDSRSIGFFAGDSLKRIDLSGGPAQTLARPASRGGAWSPDGVILFGATSAPLFRVPATGGQVTTVTTLVPGEISHRFPQFLTGGRQFLFFSYGAEDTAGIYLGSLDTAETRRLTAADTPGVFTATGWLFFVRQETLVARRFDVARGELSGEPVVAATRVATESNTRLGAFSVSAEGVVAYRTGGSSQNQLTWFDRAGRALGTLGEAVGIQVDPAVAPDGRRVAVSRAARGVAYGIWLLDAARTARLTFDQRSNRNPVWSPDGSRIAFRANGDGTTRLYQKPSSGAGAEEPLIDVPADTKVTSWSPDGRSLLYCATASSTGDDLWVLPMALRGPQGHPEQGRGMAGDRTPFPFLNSAFNECNGVFSPDGRVVAYESNESGRREVYVRPFSGQGGQWQVSTSGGMSPRWRSDGRELYYVAPDSTLMAVPIASTGVALEAGRPTALFKPRMALSGAGTTVYRQQYDVAPDGRFLINVTTLDDSTAPITVIQHWNPEAKK